MERNNFHINTEEPFEASENVKKQLVSEIDLIRDAMVIVNMFIGEPFSIGATLLQEFESKKSQKR